MEYTIQPQETTQRSRQQRHPLVRFLAFVLAACSVFSLIPPAAVMAAPEHTLNCPLVIHQHDVACYNEASEMICGKANYVVHTHSDNCYGADSSLVCGLTEIEAHDHTDACFAADETLICGKEVVVLHTHSDACRDEEDNLICGKLEVVEHIHNDACFIAAVADTTPVETTAETTAETTTATTAATEASTLETTAATTIVTEATDATEVTEATEATTATEATETPKLPGMMFSAAAPASAEIIDQGTCGENLTWVLTNDGNLTISGEGAMEDYTYSAYAPWYSIRSLITSVTITEGVTSIGDFAFQYCGNMTSITIADDVTSIGAYAYYGCSNLVTFTVPGNATRIGNGAFCNCRSLTNIALPDNVTSIGSQAFYNCTSLKSITIPESVTSISSEVFYGCSSLTSIDIPESVTSISDYAFYNCSSLTEITIPQSVTSISEKAFYNCTSLASIVIPERVTSIGNWAFLNCSRLTSVTLSDNLTSIGDYAFQSCSSLSEISIPDSVTSIGKGAFSGCRSLTQITIPEGVTSIGDYTFSGCTGLTEFTIPNSVASIGDYAFEFCSGFTTIAIPEGVPSIGNYAFQYCSSLTEITIPQSVTSIGDFAFYNCSALTEITIPQSVTSIGDYAFYNCSSLTSIDIPESVTSIRDYAFYNCNSLTEITIPQSVTSIGEKAFYNCTSLTSIVILERVTSIGTEAFRDCDSLTSVTIAGNVTSMGDYVFSDCDNLASVTITGDVTQISPCAFVNCVNLTNIALPDSVTAIGPAAFRNCRSLTEITIPQSVTSISNSTFYDCFSLTSIDIPESVTFIDPNAFNHCGSLTSIDIPESVTSIGAFAFEYCSSLTEITIPQSITFIGDYAFHSCSGLTSATIAGDNANMGSYVFSGCDNLTSITIVGDIANMGEGAFENCDNLTSVTIIGDIASMGTHAFYNCNNLTQVAISGNVTSIGDYTFNDCFSLTEVNISGNVTSIGDYAFSYCSKLTEITIPNGATSIGNNAFSRCFNLAEISFPDSITSIGNHAFSECFNLAEISFPDSITSIGDYAFSECNKLTSIIIPHNLTSIGVSAFNNCCELVDITIENGSVSFGSDAFFGCSNLKNVIIGSNADTVTFDVLHTLDTCNELEQDYYFTGPNHFHYSGESFSQGKLLLTESDYYADEYGVLYRLNSDGSTALIYCPEDLETEEYAILSAIPSEDGSVTYTVTAIEDAAMENCSKLKKVIIPNTITTISDSAFQNCSSLTQISIPGSVKSIGPSAFRNCAGLAEISLSDGICTISPYAFWNCSGITQLTIPESVTAIGNYAFYNCTQLASVNGESSLTAVLEDWAHTGAISTTFRNTALSGEDSIITTEKITYTEDTGSPEQPGREISISTDKSQLLTGEMANTRIYIERGENDSTSVVRVYFQFANEHGSINAQDDEFVFDDTIVARLCTANVPNTYFIEIQPLKAGETFELILQSTYDSIVSDGGPALIWLSIMSIDEAAELGTSVTVPETAHEVIWQTQPNTFEFASFATSTDARLMGSGTDQGDPSVRGLDYRIKLIRVGDALAYGQDHVVSVDFVDTLSLPANFYWREGLVEAISNGEWYVRQEANLGYCAYVEVEGTEYLLAAVELGSEHIDAVGLNVDEENNIQLLWTYNNPNVMEEYPTGSPFVVTFGDEVIFGSTADLAEAVNKANSNIYVSFENTYTATLHYSFSDDQHLQASSTQLLSIGAASYDIYKEKIAFIDNTRMGSPIAFEIRLRNTSSLHYTNLDYVIDEVPNYFYISAEDLTTMFYEDPYREFLSVTIDHATLCTPVAHEVVDRDGNTYVITQQFEGINSPYNDKAPLGSDESITEDNVALRISWSEDKTHLVLEKGIMTNDGFVREESYPIGLGYQYTTIQQALDSVGFIITTNTAYTCRWDQKEQTLYSGETRTFYVRSTRKDTFMRLIGDQDWFIVNGIYATTNNTVYAYSAGEEPTYDSYSTGDITLWQDFSLFKDAYFNGIATGETTLLQAGDVLTYQTVVKHEGLASYEALPLVDHMTGAQVLLVSCDDNTHLADSGLQTTDVDGHTYYILNKEGTYEDVQVGTHWADLVRIELTDAGVDTMVYWYLTDIVGEVTVTVKYQALVSPELAFLEIEGASYSLSNEVWLNDHQTHRLYDTAFIYGAVLEMNKNIVTNISSDEAGDLSDHDPSGDALASTSAITPGQTVTYRLLLGSLGSGSHTVRGADMFDTLPASVNSYWNDENVTIAYVPAEGASVEIQNEDSWHIETDAEDPNTQYIRWNEDFSATFSGALYIYVTLTYPSGEQWGDLAHAYGADTLYNTFQVYQLRSFVSHVLSVQAEALLEKDVQSTLVGLDREFYYNNQPDSLLFYTNDNQAHGFVTYSITIYNSGDCRMYLSPIQDVLPKGFTFAGLCEECTDTDYSGYFTGTSNSGYYDTAVFIDDPQNDDVVFKHAYIMTSTKNDNGKQVITFSLSKYGEDNSIYYDKDLEKYYLNPGEAVVIAYRCRTNTYPETQDMATNLVSMPFFDYNGAGAHVDIETVIDRAYWSGIRSNNGNRFLVTNGQAELWGMNTDNTDDSVQWLSSEVTICRGSIQPGISKSATAPFAHAFSPITWTVRASNSGTDDMRGYTLTDVMMAPYQFTGTVSYKIGYDRYADTYAIAESLFTFGPRASEDDQVTITSPTGDTAVLTISNAGNDENSDENSDIKNYAEITTRVIAVDRAGTTTYTPTIQVSLRLDEFGNEVLSIRFPDEINFTDNDTDSDARITNIPARGYGILTLQTQNFTGSYYNTTFYNTAYLTPSENQPFDTTAVSRGNYIVYDGDNSVVSEDCVGVYYGYFTSSVKAVTEINNSSNSTKSTNNVNYITLAEDTSPFRYTLTVENTGGNYTSKAIDQFILIDNLPQPDDHVTFYPSIQRFSDFRVNFREDSNFSVKVDGKELGATAYALQFTTATEFSEADLNGTSTTGWYTMQQIDANESLSLKDMRSFRILIMDETGTIIPAGATIAVEFDAEADLSQGKIAPCSTAWNSFGYSYSLIESENMLAASPQKVGVRMPSVPTLVKELQYTDGRPYQATEDTTFRFVVYKGTAVELPDNFTEADAFSALADIPFTVVELTVKTGETISDALSLDELYCYCYENGALEQTDTAWVWENGKDYPLLELPADERYQFDSFNGIYSNNYTFTYNAAIPQSFTCVNLRSTWEIVVEKKCATTGELLPGAVFGLYSPSTEDMVSDEKFAELTAQLKNAPQTELTVENHTCYLMDIQTTDFSGQIHWSNLTAEQYYLLELQPPVGYVPNAQPGQMVQAAFNETVQVTITNHTDHDLPHTGGPGTGMIYGAGTALTGVSLLLGWRKKRRSKKNSNT